MKSLVIGVGLGLTAGLLIYLALVLLGACPALSVLNLPAFYLLVWLTGGSGHFLALAGAVLFQWMGLGAMGGLIWQGWRQKNIRRWLLSGLAASLMIGLGLILWHVKSVSKDGLTAADFSGEKVYQGLLPGHGQIIFNLDWHSDLTHALLCQQNGKDWGLHKNFQNRKLVSAWVQDETNATIGQLTFQGEPRVGGWLQGTWQPANRKAVEPVKFQCVAALCHREHDFVHYYQLNISVTEGREFPVFPPNWRMGNITRALDQNWWEKQQEDPEQPVSGFRRGLNEVKSWFAGRACEPVTANRSMQVVHVSDKLVSLTTYSLEDGMPASSEVRLTWNFVNTNGGFRQFGLAELFRQKTPWAERLSTLCLKQLGPLPETASLKHFSAAEMNEFSVLPAGLLINFDPSYFGVGSENVFKAMIPWSQLQDLLNTNGPARFVVPVLTETML